MSGDVHVQFCERRWGKLLASTHLLLGLTGPKEDAIVIKEKIASFLHDSLKLELNSEKTLITHARDQKANFLGYEIHVLHEDSKHDHRGQRCINGSIGLRVPVRVVKDKRARYMQRGKPIHIPRRSIDEAYSIVAQYQAELRGIVQYYRMAYNLHTLNVLKFAMEVSLVKNVGEEIQNNVH